jgi:DNA-binding transcriptional ArsR family regulator
MVTDHDMVTDHAVDDLHAALADPTRRRILDELANRGEATATELHGGLPVTRQAVAKHLAILHRTGLVSAERHGREVRYAVNPARLLAAADAMRDLAEKWAARLAVGESSGTGRGA